MIAIDKSKYYRMGFNDAEIDEAIKEIENEENQTSNSLQQSYNQIMNANKSLNPANTIFSGQNNQDNLVKWQTEFDKDLERIEHILRGNKPTNINGNIVFLPPNDEKDKLFNDSGVAQIMQVVHMYLNKNTILSNYDEDTINEKMYDFGIEFSNLIYLKYQQMGLNTSEKRKRYSMIVREIVDAVHSAYLRALNGGERESLRTARNIQQTEMLNQGQPMQMQPIRERGILNPLRIFKGKYY